QFGELGAHWSPASILGACFEIPLVKSHVQEQGDDDGMHGTFFTLSCTGVDEL
ncbi:unnamed protein product, partial [Pleuronectes platessa]